MNTLFDAEEYERFDPPWGSGPMPLWMFPEAKREQIASLVALPEPPPKWIGGELGQMVSRAWYEWHRARGYDPRKIRDKLPRWLREATIERDGYTCGLCGTDVEPDDVHIDHIIPVSRGGADVLNNLQVAHSFCNISKGARMPGVAV